MINKRLLIKNLLAHNGENSFYDKKRSIDIGIKEGKAKFLKHVCALANSNPNNRSFIVIGVTDAENHIVGVDFFDDSKIQNLVNAYLHNPPLIIYENIYFPNLPEGKVIGLVTISSSGKICSLRKNIWKYWGGTVFIREGSISLPKDTDSTTNSLNEEAVQAIELSAQNNIRLTLDAVVDFIHIRHRDLESNYQVFRDQFVVCWAGVQKKVNDQLFYSRVDIELITEEVKLFYSALDEVEIQLNDHSLEILEYIRLGLGREKKYYPLEKTEIVFKENGSYVIDTELLFSPPLFDQKTLFHVFNNAKTLLQRLSDKGSFKASELTEMDQIPETLLLCFMNGFSEAKDLLHLAKPLLKKSFPKAYVSLKESLRVLRKVQYNN